MASGYRYDIERLDGETNGDNGLTILNNSKPNCLPAQGSLDADLVKIRPNTIILNSGPEGSWGRSDSKTCTFDLDANTGEIRISMEDRSTNQWAKKAANKKTYAENTRDFLKGYVLAPTKLGGKRNSTRKAVKAVKTVKTRKTHTRVTIKHNRSK